MQTLSLTSCTMYIYVCMLFLLLFFYSMDPSTPSYKMHAYIVYEKCLLELFEVCPVCQRGTRVRTRTVGTFLCVEQRCPHCDFVRKWNSQPLHGGTPAGNLQLSVAVYSNGGSFFRVEKVLTLHSMLQSCNVVNFGIFEKCLFLLRYSEQ